MEQPEGGDLASWYILLSYISPPDILDLFDVNPKHPFCSLCPFQSNECNHFFQLKNVSFCGYHPKNSK